MTGLLERGSLTTWFVVLAVVVAAGGGIWLGDRRDAQRRVVVAVQAIDAFGVAQRVRLETVDKTDVPRAPVGTLAAARGRYVVRSVEAGDPLSTDDLGPRPRSPTDVVVPVPLTDERGPELRAGEVADLLLAPSVAKVCPALVRDALVVHVSADSGTRVAYFAMPRAAERRVARVLGRGKAIVAARE